MELTNIEIRTTPLVMARIKRVLDKIDIAVFPEEDEDFGIFAQSILMELSYSKEEYNGLFREITGKDDIDFMQEESEQLEEILKNFFVKLGVNFKKLMLIKKKDLQRQNDMAIEKMTDSLVKMMTENLSSLSLFRQKNIIEKEST